MSSLYLLLLVAVALLLVAATGFGAPLTTQELASIDARANALIAQMTLEEKIAMVHGIGRAGFTGYIPANERLGIPAVKMADGPVGVRAGESTAFPAPICMAATWNPEVINRVGQALGREVLGKGHNVLLGPCINIARLPQGGRSFEAFGEDPYLASRMAVAYITGVQSQGVIADAKHFAANNQEEQRGTISAEVDERTMREIFLPAFRAAVEEAGVWSVMAAYNKINDTYCSENNWLLRDVLKGDWGFQGFVVSDWGATHSTVGCALGGLDVDMPGSDYYKNSLRGAVRNGQIEPAVLDEMVRRVLRPMLAQGLFEREDEPNPALVDTPENRMAALDTAREGFVLLKNEGSLLPLDLSKIKRLAVIGPHAGKLRAVGGGSAFVSPAYTVTPLEALQKLVGDQVELVYAEGCDLQGTMTSLPSTCLLPPVGVEGKHGLLGEYFKGKDFTGEPVIKRVDESVDFRWGGAGPGGGLGADNYCVRWTGRLVVPTSGSYGLGATSDDGMRLYLDNQLVLDRWNDRAETTDMTTVELEAGREYALRVEYYQNTGDAVMRLGLMQPGQQEYSEAITAATGADAALLFVGLDSSIETEGRDRTSLDLPAPQVGLIKAVAAVNPSTIVVLNCGAPVLMDEWLPQVKSLLLTWYMGENGAEAAAEMLFGIRSPSGKLPVTFPRRWADTPAFLNYPGKDGIVPYSEGVFVGYRWYDQQGIEPLFPFGYGLSYTTFAYRDLQVTPGSPAAGEPVTVSFEVSNTGSVTAAEVAQVYVGDPKASVSRPPSELKAFTKVLLKPGETKTVTLTLGPEAFAFWDVIRDDWYVEPGSFQIRIGGSSRDLPLTAEIRIK